MNDPVTSCIPRCRARSPNSPQQPQPRLKRDRTLIGPPSDEVDLPDALPTLSPSQQSPSTPSPFALNPHAPQFHPRASTSVLEATSYDAIRVDFEESPVEPVSILTNRRSSRIKVRLPTGNREGEMAPPPAHSTSPLNRTPPTLAPIKARIPTTFEMLKMTAVAVEWQEKWDESQPAFRDHNAIWIAIREKHEKKIIEEMPQDSKVALERSERLVRERIMGLSQGLQEESEDEAARLTAGLRFLTGSLAFDHESKVTEALRGISDVEVLEFVRSRSYEFGNFLQKWGVRDTSLTTRSSTQGTSSTVSTASASAPQHQLGSLRLGSASRKTFAQVSEEKEKATRRKMKGKNPGKWGNKDNYRKRIFAVQGARSQFENIFDKNVSLEGKYPKAFVDKVYEELDEMVKDSTVVDPTSETMEAIHFAPIALVDNLVSPTIDKPTLPGWGFVQLLEGHELLDHYRNTGPFNPRNGLASTNQVNGYTDEFEMSFIPLTEDDPAEILQTFQYVVVPHSPSAAIYLHKHKYKPRQVLTIHNHSELFRSNRHLADTNDLPNPVDVLFHHHACSIFRFRAAAEPILLEVESDEEEGTGFEVLGGAVEDKAQFCQTWLNDISSWDLIGQQLSNPR